MGEDKLTNQLLLNEVSKLLVCENMDGCNICGNCAKSNAKSHPDIILYPKGKMFTVEDAANIYDNVQIKPMLANLKIFVIDAIDNSTEQAQNKMLKIIEEPPKNVVFLISATNQNKVLKTILSRVQKIAVDKFPKGILENALNIDLKIKDIAIAAGDGNLGKTIQIAEDSEFLKNYENMKSLISNFKNSGQIPEFSRLFVEDKNIFENCLTILNGFFRDILILNLNCPNLVTNNNLCQEFEIIKNEYSVGALVSILKILDDAKQKIDASVNLTMVADNMLLKILEVKFLCK